MKAFRIVAGLLAFLVLLAVAVPFLVPMGTYKREIEERVSAAAGRPFAIHGDIRLSLLPGIGVTITDVSLGNPEGFGGTEMAHVKRVTAHLALGPLTAGQIEVSSITLDAPVLRLERNRDGHANWEFETLRKAAAPAANGAAPTAKTSGAALPFAVKKLRVENAAIVWRDGVSGRSYTAEDFDLTTAADTLSQPVRAQGSATLNGKKLRFEGALDSPSALNATGNASLSVSLDAEDLDLSFSGKVTHSTLAGQTQLQAPSLPALAAWLGTPVAWKGGTPLKVEAKGQLHCSPSECRMTDTALALDSIQAQGALAASFAGVAPAFDVALKTASLDITPYLPRPAHAGASPFTLIGQANAASAQEWSREPLPLDALKNLNLTLALDADAFTARKLTAGDMQLRVEAKDGRVAINLPSVKCYGGGGSVRLNVDMQGDVPQLAQHVRVTGFQAEPLLTNLWGFDRLAGTGSAEYRVTARGGNMHDIVSTLSGDGRVKFTDGAVKGINLAAMIRNVKSAFTGEGQAAQQTDFAELEGSFKLVEGVAGNDDLLLKAPLLRLRGNGTVNLLQRSVSYRLLPELVASLKGQGGKDKEGLEVPIIVEGTFDRLHFRPDLEGMARGLLEKPEDLPQKIDTLKEQFKENRGQIKDDLKNLLKKF